MEDNNSAGGTTSIQPAGVPAQVPTPRPRKTMAGENNGRAILTAEQVIAIYADQTSRTTDLSRRYGVHENTISMIRHGKRWVHITQPKTADVLSGAPVDAAGHGAS